MCVLPMHNCSLSLKLVDLIVFSPQYHLYAALLVIEHDPLSMRNTSLLS